MAPQWTATKGWSTSALMRWMARAMTSLPVPLSPSRSTVARVAAALRALARTSCMAALVPTRPKARAWEALSWVVVPERGRNPGMGGSGPSTPQRTEPSEPHSARTLASMGAASGLSARRMGRAATSAIMRFNSGGGQAPLAVITHRSTSRGARAGEAPRSTVTSHRPAHRCSSPPVSSPRVDQ